MLHEPPPAEDLTPLLSQALGGNLTGKHGPPQGSGPSLTLLCLSLRSCQEPHPPREGRRAHLFGQLRRQPGQSHRGGSQNQPVWGGGIAWGLDGGADHSGGRLWGQRGHPSPREPEAPTAEHRGGECSCCGTEMRTLGWPGPQTDAHSPPSQGPGNLGRNRSGVQPPEKTQRTAPTPGAPCLCEPTRGFS